METIRERAVSELPRLEAAELTPRFSSQKTLQEEEAVTWQDSTQEIKVPLLFKQWD